MKRWLPLVITPTLLAMGWFPNTDKGVSIPLRGTMCADGPPVNGQWVSTTWPVLYAFNGKARLGPVQPGTCAWIDGYTAKSAITLVCEEHNGLGRVSSPRAVEVPPCSGATCKLCPVPASQDFR
jgi:hypothetical protein